MKSSWIVFGAMFAASSAFAAQPQLKLTQRTGTVAPAYQFELTCTIGAKSVRIKKSGGKEVTPIDTQHVVAWTDSVQSAEQMLELIQEAKNGNVEDYKGPRPIGGGTSDYTAAVITARHRTAIKLHSEYYYHNDSAVTQTLVDFIDYNCKQQ